MLKGKTVLLGITGSIAAYKIANLASMLVKMEANVHVLMTKNACNFINPITFETLTKHKCLVDTFDRNFEYSVEHVSLAKQADVMLIAPATANVIGKMANGICDDMLTTTAFACKCPIIISPAMNTNMYTNPILQDNLKKLEGYGYHIITPANGHLACGDNGLGKMPDEALLFEYIYEYLFKTEELKGKKVLISAGATQEALDPVRYITNHSTGKMGYNLAKAFYLKGADVVVVSANTFAHLFHGIKEIKAFSANDMFLAIDKIYKEFDYIVLCAAVSDYTPLNYSENKIKKSDDDLTISLTRTKDILAYLGQNKASNQRLIGFSMETCNLVENSTIKLNKKNCDMICANSISNNKTGFGVDTNQVTLIKKDGIKELPFDTKENVAKMIVEEVMKL